MIKLKNLLLEGTIRLTDDEKDQIARLVPEVLNALREDYLPPSEWLRIGFINYKLADGSDGIVKVCVGNDAPKYTAYYERKDPKNLEDNIIVVQQAQFKPIMFPVKVYSAVTGDNNVVVQGVKAALTHELIHAKDPAQNHHFFKEKYDSSNPELYFGTWAEFQTLTGQFFEAIDSGVETALNTMDKQEILDVLDDILNFYSGKQSSMSQNTADFIQKTGKRNAFQSLMKHGSNFIKFILGNTVSTDILDIYVTFINQIKKYNPEGYKEYLKDLYKTIEEAKTKVKSHKDKWQAYSDRNSVFRK